MTIHQIIRQSYPKLSTSERMIADRIINNEIDVAVHSITQAARIAGVSPSLVNKFSLKCGLTGWKTFRGLAFNSLHSLDKNDSKGFFTEEFIAMQNIFYLKKRMIDRQLSKLNNDINTARKTTFFARGSTKIIVEAIAFKLNKLGLTIQVYDFHEKSIVISIFNDCLIYVSLSGLNSGTDLKYIKQYSECHKQHLITLGSHTYLPHASEIALDAYHHFPQREKIFPVVADVFMLSLLNQLVDYRLALN